jgi:5-methylcytosine-specific restriction endonuclease McrA
MAPLLFLEVIYKEFHRRLEAVKSSLMTLCFKCHLLEWHKEVIDMFQKRLVIVGQYN